MGVGGTCWLVSAGGADPVRASTKFKIVEPYQKNRLLDLFRTRTQGKGKR